ncbi:MAG: hypothetical protein QW714_00220 [Nanopusillaceae archaeon]
MSNEILEAYKRIAPYILPIIIAIGLILVFVIPVRGPKTDVLKYETLESVGILCERLPKLNYTDRVAEYDGDRVVWIGLTTDPNYNLYLMYSRNIFGEYEIRVIRCDPEYAWFHIECRIKAPEGDEEVLLITVSRGSYRFLYTGRDPYGVTAICTPKR